MLPIWCHNSSPASPTKLMVKYSASLRDGSAKTLDSGSSGETKPGKQAHCVQTEVE